MNRIITWLGLPQSERKSILTTVSDSTGLLQNAVEKDFWVSMILKAIFNLPVGQSLVFRGGTSLSKGWHLIERFSEDIDLAIDRAFFGFGENLGRSQRGKLRRISKKYIEGTFADSLNQSLSGMGLTGYYSMRVPETIESDSDPVVLYIDYQSVLEDRNPYIPPTVKIEISCRSIMEPFDNIAMRSLIADAYPDEVFSESPFLVRTVLPGRIFIEKIFLLHEEFNRPGGCSRIARISRHFYDIEKMMDQPFAIEAMNNESLYMSTVNHRKIFTAWSGLDYNLHNPATINFVPPKYVEDEIREDYEKMQDAFIYGKSLPFDQLMERIRELQDRFRLIRFAKNIDVR